jgi:hypothetical protein
MVVASADPALAACSARSEVPVAKQLRVFTRL